MLKKIGIILLVLSIVAAIFGYSKYQDIYGTNVSTKEQDTYIYIPSGTDYNGLKNILMEGDILDNVASFEWVASLMNYDQSKVKSGKYKIEAGWSNRKLIQHLRSGKQNPVKLILNNERLLASVASQVSYFIEPDSANILSSILDPKIMSKYELSPENMMSLFIPNTYEVYWDISGSEFLARMKKENEKFWSTKGRMEKLAKLDMSKEEVYTLASIVEKETNYIPEKNTVAGVYLNRLKRGIMLQADPTVVFANQDFTIRRVLNKHLEKDSPYNTYKYAGLPPGPISMASISSIDAVLENQGHNYLFFCAKPDNSGQHAFAKTLSQHNSNARKFQKWLNQQRIFK